MKRLEKRRSEGEREREGKSERGTKRKRVGDEGAFPVRSVEKGDRGGYGVVAWVCDGTGSCRETRETGGNAGGRWARRSLKGWRERYKRRGMKGSWGVRPRERKRGRVEVNAGVRKVFKRCEEDDTIEEVRHERGAG